MLELAANLDDTVTIFQRAFAELKPRTRVPGVRVEFCQFANANSLIRLNDGQLHVRITDVLQSAPPAVQESLAHILLSKLYGREVPRRFADRYRRYLNSREVRRKLDFIRRTRGYKLASAPGGTQYDLEKLFDDLNFRYFFGLMAKPGLGWSLRPSRMTLGHYDASHNTIVLNKLLDSPRVPQLAVEYVMFHEMLHLRHPVNHAGSRRCIHTPEFKAAERQFPRYEEAKELLKKL